MNVTWQAIGFAVLFASAPLLGSEVELLPAKPVALFAGQHPLELTLRNPTGRLLQTELVFQLWQTSTATAAPWTSPGTTQAVSLLAGQTSVLAAGVFLPPVRGKTRFVLRVSEAKRLLGFVAVWNYPTELLAEMNSFLGGSPVLLAGTPASWRQVFAKAEVPYEESLERVPSEAPLRLAIFGPNLTGAEAWSAFSRAQQLARTRTGVIWIVPEAEADETANPEYYSAPVGSGFMVVARADALADLPSRPDAQERLLRMAQLACGVRKLQLPEIDL